MGRFFRGLFNVRRLVTENCVVGGGICGLMAAHTLFKHHREFILIEKEGRLGGVIRTNRVSRFDDRGRERGALVEEGPNTLLLRDRRLHDLFCELEIEEARLVAHPVSRYRYILKHGTLEALPLDPLSLVCSPLFSASAKMRIPIGLFKRAKVRNDESVGSLFSRLFHRDIVDYAIGPFVSGIWAGDPDRLCFRYAFPRIYDVVNRSGCLIAGLARRSPGKMRSQLSSFEDGMEKIVDAIAGIIKPYTKLNSRVEEIRRSPHGYEILARSKERFLIDAKRLFLATPAYVTADVLKTTGIDETADLYKIPYVPLLTTGVIFKKSDCPPKAQEGFGFLVPKNEGRKILGAIFSSSLFPNRCDHDEMLYTIYTGGRMREEIRDQPPSDVEKEALAELKSILGISADPVYVNSVYWDKAIPQFEGDYPTIRNALERVSRSEGNIHFVANYMFGISVSDCMVETERYMAKLLSK